jgi:hypothetical protein
MSDTQTSTNTCPACKKTMKEGTWPPSAAGVMIVFSGVFFLLVFMWYISGAFVEHPREANDFSPSALLKKTDKDNTFLMYFRLYMPGVVGLICLYWGWAVMTGRRALGKEPAMICDNCGHSQLKS